jgi:hypothetical protein
MGISAFSAFWGIEGAWMRENDEIQLRYYL